MTTMTKRRAATIDYEKVELPPRDELVRRARYICALGRFTQLDDRTMFIDSEEIDDFGTETILRRNDRNILLCNCPVYLTATAGAATNLKFRCEHKIALKLRKTLPKPSADINLNPESTSIETMVSPDQLNNLKKLARDLAILDKDGLPDKDKIARKRLGCNAASLSREAAQFLIDYLLEVVNFENSIDAVAIANGTAENTRNE